MKIEKVFNKIQQYLKGNINAEDFSYDFPVTFTLYATILDKENPELSKLLESELKTLCQKFDPYDMYNIPGEKCVSETDFKNQVTSIYEKAKTLVN